MIICVIPARGGSKRISRKNIRSFAGKPIIAYSIEAALASELFDKVVVSTDDEKIASVARACGAETPFIRPAALSDDHTGTNAVIKHAIQWYIDQGETVQYACCVYATAPFIQPQYLLEGFKMLAASNKHFAFSATSFPFPIQRSIRLHGDGTVEPFYPDHILARSQDLEEAYHDAGQFSWGRADAFLRDEPTFSRFSLAVVLPRYLVQDIDTLEDWERAELMFQAWKMRLRRSE